MIVMLGMLHARLAAGTVALILVWGCCTPECKHLIVGMAVMFGEVHLPIKVVEGC